MLTLRKSRSHITSGLGSPTTSQSMMTVSPSTASVDSGFVTKSGSLEYLRKREAIMYFSTLYCLRDNWTYGISGDTLIILDDSLMDD